MKTVYKSWFCYYTFLILTKVTLGQAAEDIRLSKITSNQGLSSYYITNILEDQYGFFWIGTQEGLNLYDGRSFVIFSNQSEEKHRLGGAFVSDLAEDKKRNLLWVMTSYGDICAIDLTTWTIRKRITTDINKKKLSEKWLRSICVQGDTLWIGDSRGLSCYQIDKDQYIQFKPASGNGLQIQGRNISKISIDRSGRIWAFCDGYGVLVLDGTLHILFSFPAIPRDKKQEQQKIQFWNISNSDHKMYAATNQGLKMFFYEGSDIRSLPVQTHSPLDDSEILGFAFSTDSEIWFSTPGNFYSYDFSTKRLIRWADENKDDDWLPNTFQVYYDSAYRKIWLGTQAGLASFPLEKTPFVSFSKSKSSNIRINHALSLLRIPGRSLYCGDENGLFRIDLLSKEIIKISPDVSNLLLFMDSSGNIFLSNKKGFFLIAQNQLQPVHIKFPALLPLEQDQLSSAVQFNDSIYLFSGIIQKGLHVWNKYSGRLDTYHNDSVRHSIKDLSIIDFLYKNKKGEILILTEKSIIAFNPLTSAYTTHYLKNRKTNSVISNLMDITETSNRYWIATYGNGIVEVDSDFNVLQNYTSKTGLSNDCIYRIFSNNDNLIIATTNNGLTTINNHSKQIRNYYQSDGLQSNAFEQLCGFRTEDRIYAGGVNGFTVIDPALFRDTKAIPLFYFKGVRIESPSSPADTNNISISSLVIPNDAVQTTIYFSGISYSNPERVSFSYKIKELNGEWLQNGSVNFVNFIGLSPGTYTLIARSANEDNIWSTPKELTLIVLPKWYQTLLFKILIIFALAGLFYIFYRYRIKQFKKQQQIRRDIAGDLHDDIGSTLNTVKIFSHLAKKEPFKEDHMNSVEESLTQATIGLRDMIWVLDDSRDNIHDLLERIKKYAFPICQANNIKLENYLEPDISNRPIPKTEKRNLYLIAKETINNSIKYSACTRIRIRLMQVNKRIEMLITDNGKGFIPDNAKEGYGLKSIQQRAEQIHYLLQIVSSPGNGTSVELVRK